MFKFNRLARGICPIIDSIDQIGDLSFSNQQLWPFPPEKVQNGIVFTGQVVVVNKNGIVF